MELRVVEVVGVEVVVVEEVVVGGGGRGKGGGSGVGEQFLQTTWPQTRQWWRRRNVENGVEQRGQWGAEESGTQWGCDIASAEWGVGTLGSDGSGE